MITVVVVVVVVVVPFVGFVAEKAEVVFGLALRDASADAAHASSPERLPPLEQLGQLVDVRHPLHLFFLAVRLLVLSLLLSWVVARRLSLHEGGRRGGAGPLVITSTIGSPGFHRVRGGALLSRGSGGESGGGAAAGRGGGGAGGQRGVHRVHLGARVSGRVVFENHPGGRVCFALFLVVRWRRMAVLRAVPGVLWFLHVSPALHARHLPGAGAEAASRASALSRFCLPVAKNFGGLSWWSPARSRCGLSRVWHLVKKRKKKRRMERKRT